MKDRRTLSAENLTTLLGDIKENLTEPREMSRPGWELTVVKIFILKLMHKFRLKIGIKLIGFYSEIICLLSTKFPKVSAKED